MFVYQISYKIKVLKAGLTHPDKAVEDQMTPACIHALHMLQSSILLHLLVKKLKI